MSSLNPTVSFNGGTASNPSIPIAGGYADKWNYTLTNENIGGNETIGGAVVAYADALFHTNSTLYDVNDLTSTEFIPRVTPENLRSIFPYDQENVRYEFEVSDANADSSATRTDQSITLNDSSDKSIKITAKLYVNDEYKKQKDIFVETGKRVTIASNEFFAFSNKMTSPIEGTLNYEFSRAGIEEISVPNIIASDLTQKLFTVQDNSTPVYERSSSHILQNYDWTGTSVWNNQGGVGRSCSLISPIHILMADHLPVGNGSTVRFVTNDNEVVDRTVVNSVRVGLTDIRIGVLNEDVPSSIKYYRTIDVTTLANEGEKILRWEHIPVFAVNQDNKIFMLTFKSSPRYGYFNGNIVYQEFSSDLVSRSDYSGIIENSYMYNYIGFSDDILRVGDSGRPNFITYKGELFLLCAFYAFERSPIISVYKDEINSIMSSLDSRYQLDFLDFSEFDNYQSFKTPKDAGVTPTI